MRYVAVKVTRDTNTVYNRLVPEWEVPVLEFIFEEGNVTREERFARNADPYPEVNAEFDRLVRAYGADVQTGVPYVASVYGQAARGVKMLERAIVEAEDIDLEELANPPPLPVIVKKARRISAATDSLLA